MYLSTSKSDFAYISCVQFILLVLLIMNFFNVPKSLMTQSSFIPKTIGF